MENCVAVKHETRAQTMTLGQTDPNHNSLPLQEVDMCVCVILIGNM